MFDKGHGLRLQRLRLCEESGGRRTCEIRQRPVLRLRCPLAATCPLRHRQMGLRRKARNHVHANGLDVLVWLGAP